MERSPHKGTTLLAYLERSYSGLVRSFGKAVYPQGYRGFKSRPLRFHLAVALSEGGLRLDAIDYILVFLDIIGEVTARRGPPTKTSAGRFHLAVALA
jgi:hypothetical protein